jgi:hypothetical protein
MHEYRVWHSWKSSFGEDYRQIAERCVYLEAYSPEQAAERAKGVVQAVYSEVNVFDVTTWSMNRPSRISS